MTWYHCSRVMEKGTLVMDKGPQIKVWYCWICDHIIRRSTTQFEVDADQKLGTTKGGDKSGA